MSEVGELLAGRYRLRRQLGSGAMGVVWEAVDERLRRTVAVKQLIPESGLDPARAEEARQRAMREGRIAARLHHPNAVAVHDVTEHDGLPVLVMEYVPSRSLADVLAERGTLAPEVVAGIGAQAASALEAAHAEGIVHRDIKPGNVLVADDGTVKITDFGISHAADDVAVTRTGMLAGTPAYLAPEVAQGRAPTPSSDVFSLAVTLYEAVEGRTPFDRDDSPPENSLALLHVVAAGNVVPPRQAGALTPVLERMLDVDPARRPQPTRLREVMRAVEAGEPLPADLGPSTSDVTQPIRAVGAATAVASSGGNGTRVDAQPLGPTGAPAGRGSRGWLVAVAVVVAVALLGVGLVVAQLGTSGDSQRPAAPPTRGLDPVQLERVVSDYYALLPEHPANAWRRLGPGMRAQGHARYVNSWDNVSDVRVLSQPRATARNTVRIRIQRTVRDGARIREVHRIGLIESGGTPLINADTVLRAQRIPPPERTGDRGEKNKRDGQDKKNEQDKKKDESDKGEQSRKERGKGEKDKSGETDKKGENG